jgi:hypothetical protein
VAEGLHSAVKEASEDPVLHFVWLTRRHAQGKSATKASKLEPSSTKLAAVSVRNPSETKS